MKKWGIFLIIIFAVVFCKAYLFRIFFSYDIIKERTVLDIANEKLKNRLKETEKITTMEDLLQNSLKETASTLNFSFDKCDHETDKLVETKKANCIGYSAFLASVIQFKLKQSGLQNDWKVHHNVGEIYLMNENINRHFNSGFFKDHDFVTVENVKTKETIGVDATGYDYFRIERIKLK